MATNVARALDRQRFGHVIYIGFRCRLWIRRQPRHRDDAGGTGRRVWVRQVRAGEKILEVVTSPRSIPLLILRVAGVYGPGDPHGSYGPNSFARLDGEGSDAADVRRWRGGARSHSSSRMSAASRPRCSARGHRRAQHRDGEARSFAEVAKAVRDLVPYDFTINNVLRKGPITHRRYDTSRPAPGRPGLWVHAVFRGTARHAARIRSAAGCVRSISLDRYPRVKRNIAASEAAVPVKRAIARRFGREYFDGERGQGYGGYRYDGRWVPIAERMRDFYGLKPGDRILDVGLRERLPPSRFSATWCRASSWLVSTSRRTRSSMRWMTCGRSAWSAAPTRCRIQKARSTSPSRSTPCTTSSCPAARRPSARWSA